MSFTRKLSFTILALFAVTALSHQAFASGDSGCSPAWRLLHRSYDGCANMAFLSPSNDTRVNLLLMLADLEGKKPPPGAFGRQDAPLVLWNTLSYRFVPQAPKSTPAGVTQDAHAPCDGPMPTDDPFTRALQAEITIGAEERTALLRARSKTQGGCPADAATAAAAP